MTEAKTPPTAPGNQKPKQTDPEVDQLLREGLAAIKLGDKVSARTKLQEVVTRDPNNEKGWFYLASVVETNDERRVCLGNVMVINPKNQKAQVMLDRLSGNANAGLIIGDADFDSTAGGKAAAGIPRNRLILIGLVAGVVVLGIVFFALSAGGRGAPPPTPTTASISAASSATVPPTASPVISAAGTGPATQNVKPTLPPVAPTLPPTWTPEASVTAAGQLGTPMAAPPPGLTGRMVVISGSILTTDRSLPVFIMDPYGKNMQPISQNSTADAGDYGILTPDGQRLIYSRFLASTNTRQLRASFANGTRPAELSSMWGNVPPLADAQMPSLARNGSILAFVATSLTENETTSAIYAVPAKLLPPFGNEDTTPTEISANVPTVEKATSVKPTKAVTAMPVPPTSSAPTLTPTANGAVAQVRRLTVKNNGINSWPSVSPDGTKVVYVSDSKPQGVDGVDLFVVSINGGTPKKLTDDLTANTEAAPEWSPDGKRIAYQVMAQGAQTNDIWIMDADGSNKAALVTGGGDNIRPHWSPDGNFIAFTSNRNSQWQVYIIELSSKTIYQVTQTPVSTICTGWGPK